MTYTSTRRRAVRLAVPALCLAMAGVATSSRPWAAEDLPLATPESVGMSSERLQRVDEYFQRFIDDNQIVGAVTLIARKGKVVHHSALGWKYKEEDVAMTTDTIFGLASMTKPIVSAALMMLFEEGRFRLDDPISDWIPEYADHMVRVTDGPRQRRVREAASVTS